MAEKLSDTWTTFAKKQKADLDDDALIKVLGKVDKTDASKPELLREALKDAVDLLKKQVVNLAKRKKELGDKVFGEIKDKLYDVLESAERLQKDTETAMAKAAAAQAETKAKAEAEAKAKAKDGEDDEEEDTPVLLSRNKTSKSLICR